MPKPLILKFDVADLGTAKIAGINRALDAMDARILASQAKLSAYDKSLIGTNAALGTMATGLTGTGAAVTGFNSTLVTTTAVAARHEKQVHALNRAFVGLKSTVLSMKGLIAGALGAGGLAVATRTIASFEEAMSRVKSVSGATGDEMARMTELARRLGATTEHTATQAAEGLTYLSMAGFNANASIAALPATLDLATAGQISMGEAADIASNILSGFSAKASEAGRYMDVMAAAAANSNTDIYQLGQAMSYAAPLAASLKISVEDTAAAIGVLSNAGIQSGRAGRNLRGILSSLIAPTKDGAKALAEMGLSLDEVNPSMHSLYDIMTKLREANISESQAIRLFGKEMLSGALAIINNTESLGEMIEVTNNAEGALAEMASIMRDNLGGAIKEFTSAVDELFLGLGDAGLTDALKGAFQGMTNFVRSLQGGAAVRAVAGSVQFLVTHFQTLVKIVAALMLLKFNLWMMEVVTSLDLAGRHAILFTGRLTATRAAVAATILPLRALKTVLATLGGPVGVLTLAAQAMIFFAATTKRVKSPVDDARDSVTALIEELKLLAQGSVDIRFNEQMQELEYAIRGTTSQLEIARAELERYKKEAEARPAYSMGIYGGVMSGPGWADQKVAEVTEEIARLEAQLVEQMQLRGSLNQAYGAALQERKRQQDEINLAVLEEVENLTEAVAEEEKLINLRALRAEASLITIRSRVSEAQKELDIQRQINQRRAQLEGIEGAGLEQKITRLELIEREFEYRKASLELQKELLNAELDLQLALSEEERSLREIANLKDDIRAIDLELQSLPRLQQLEEQIEREKMITEEKRLQAEWMRTQEELAREAERLRIERIESSDFGTQFVAGISDGLAQAREETQSFYQITKEAFADLYNTLSRGFSGAFVGFITGAQTAQEAFSSFAKSVVTWIMEMVAKMIFQATVGRALSALLGTSSAAAGSAAAASWAPAALFASIATLGGAVAVGTGALMGSTALMTGMAASMSAAAGAFQMADAGASSIPTMHSGGLVTGEGPRVPGLAGDEVLRVLQVGERVKSRQEVRQEASSMGGDRRQPFQINLDIINTINDEDILRSLSSDKGRTVIVNQVARDVSENGRMRRVIRGESS